MPRRTIAGCRTIVTGATSGIGHALVLELVRQQAHVIATGRRKERLMALVHETAGLPGQIEVVAGDIADAATREALTACAMDRLGGLDLLVNNAGVGIIRDFEKSESAQLRHVMEVNFFAAVEMTRATLPLLSAGRQPMIVNVASILGHRGIPHYSEYCASKFALVGFSESLRAELAGQGIDVLIVSPGTTQSEFFESLAAEQSGVGSRGEGGVRPEAVAAATVRAIRQGRHLIVPNRQGWILLCLNRLSPRLADALVARFG